MTKKIKVVNIVGARPNFMKMAALYRGYRRHKNIQPVLIHTGQHKDKNMSEVFLKDLGLGRPDYQLHLSSKSPVSNISEIINKLEPIISTEKPDLIVVVGDINSTLAAALVANKMGIKLAHVESGLRSRDRKMPEEINRVLVDSLSDMLFVTEKSGLHNLKKEGVEPERIFFVGNTMIDTLIQMMPKIISLKTVEALNLQPPYIVMTMHRPSNVDTKEGLGLILKTITEVIAKPAIEGVVFPIHPRTLKNLQKFGFLKKFSSIPKLKIIKPLDYPNFISLVRSSVCVITDSGGIQEEAAYLKVPTITLRNSTERPSTIECGANILNPIDNYKKMDKTLNLILSKRSNIKDIPLNDGLSAERIVQIIIDHHDK